MARPRLCFALLLASLAFTSGCEELTGPNYEVTPSIWINARWIGGRTGTPGDVKAVVPPEVKASHCPTTSVQLYNHGSPIPGSTNLNGLIIRNNCTVPVSYLVCATSGGSVFNGIPTCAVDPRKTPLDFTLSFDLGTSSTNNYEYVGNTQLNLDVNVFYCPTGWDFTIGIIESDAPTDCYRPKE